MTAMGVLSAPAGRGCPNLPVPVICAMTSDANRWQLVRFESTDDVVHPPLGPNNTTLAPIRTTMPPSTSHRSGRTPSTTQSQARAKPERPQRRFRHRRHRPGQHGPWVQASGAKRRPQAKPDRGSATGPSPPSATKPRTRSSPRSQQGRQGHKLRRLRSNLSFWVTVAE